MSRIIPTMNEFEIVSVLSDNNDDVIKLLSGMLRSESPIHAISNLFVLDRYEIYGTEILKLWELACEKDMGKFDKTIDLFRTNKISKNEVHRRLNFFQIIPFVD